MENRLPKKKLPKKKTKWPQMPWDKVVDLVERAVFQIWAEGSTGTCFLISVGKQHQSNSDNYMFATAWHVVEKIAGSEQSIFLSSSDGKSIYETAAGSYGIFRLGSEVFDTAGIWLKSPAKIVSQEDLLPILGYQWQMARGTEIGWVGFPGIAGGNLCFFRGVVSGYYDSPPTYLVDGVAVNGVSGGPAFDDRAHIIGLISSYIPNRVDQFTTLPGLVGVIPIAAIRYWLERKMKAQVIHRGPKGT